MNNDPKGKKPQDNKPQNNDDGRQGRRIVFLMVAALIATLLINSVYTSIANAYLSEIPYNEFQEYLDKDEIAELEFQSDRIVILTREEAKKPAAQQRMYYTGIIPNYDNSELKAQLDKQGVIYNTEIVEQASPIVTFVVTWLLPVIIMYALFSLLMRSMSKRMGGGIGGIGESKAKVYMEKSTGVTFADVAGQDEAKESLVEIIDFLHNPQKYAAIGAKLPKGALLVGPPGTGKTLMARAVAGEAGVQFLSISGSDFVELYVGVGASRVRDLFDQAKKVAPAIVFIDEIDAVGRQRGSGLGGGHDEREQTLNQLLVEMDGFTNNEGVIVMAATNRADILDNALLRPGRFDRRVYMGLPDIKGREEILKVHARGKPLGDDVDLKSIARGTAGFAGADLENLLNEAAIMATRSKRRFIMQADIDEAILKVVMGPEKKSRVVSERARRLTAYHESGHAIASFFLKNSDPVHYITIIPRGAAGGFTWYRKAEDAENFTSRGEMFDSIVSALGGRIAEQLFLDDISTGASNDIQQATNIARDMVMKYGMSEKLGPISFDDSSHSIFIGRDFGTTKSYSEETAATIDEEVKHLFDQAYAKCEALLREHADLLTGLAEYLLIHETIEGDDFRYYCEHGEMPVHPDDTIEPPAKVIRRMDEAPETPQPDAEAPAQPEAPSAPDADAPNSDPGEQP